MKKILSIYQIIFLIFSFFILTRSAEAQPASFEWAKQMGGILTDEAYSITVDDAGNILTTGVFDNGCDFDPGTGVYYLNPVLGYLDIYVAKQDNFGNLIWAKQFGGPQYDYPTSITADHSGNVYITGYFQDTVDFDPGIDTMKMISHGGNDIFLLKLDSAGNFIWVKTIGGTANDRCMSMTNGASGNLYLTGTFQDTVDFNPDTAVSKISAFGGGDIFVLKLDSSGGFIWAKRMGGSADDIGNSITTGAGENVFIAGSFKGNCDFDPGLPNFNISSYGSDDIFIAELTSSGNFIRAVRMGGNSDDIANAIAIDIEGNILTTGTFRATADFDPGNQAFNMTCAGVSNAFVSKLDSTGNFIWAKQIGGAGIDNSVAVKTDLYSGVYVAGQFQNTVDFDPAAGVYNLSSSGGFDVYVCKYDRYGDFLWVKKMGGTGDDALGNFDVDAVGSVYTAGGFHDVADFDPDTSAVFNLTAPAGQYDIFIQKMSQLLTGVHADGSISSPLLIFPNPAKDRVVIKSLNEINELTLVNLLGMNIYSSSASSDYFEINTIDIPDGVYFVQLRAGRNLTAGRLIIQH